ncbi:O-antigen ligase family protein, partial [Roseomonas sp. GC11]|uniref:O-antigen ligase family protein n=1 Tax=Roseomonas sp. GC11 TaxID=2950546 RepID=UPI00210A6055
PRLLGRALLAGLSLGLAAALADSASGSALRAAVRGLREVPPQLVFGLKPAASVMALLLPLLAALPWPGPRSGPRSGPWPRAMRSLLLLAGTALLLLAPGDTAKLAALAGLVVALLALWLPAGGRQVMGWLLGAGMAGVLLATPPLLGLLLREVPPVVERLPPSAIHRLVIWQFGLERAAEKPLAGWGMEAARALPGGEDQPERARLEALGLRSPALFGWFTAMRSTLMPLHPHNGPLQIRLELGLVGSALAALALLLLAGRAAGGEGVPPAAALGAMASGFVTFLASFGAWQPWWLCSLALALALARGLAGGGSSAAGARAGEQP